MNSEFDDKLVQVVHNSENNCFVIDVDGSVAGVLKYEESSPGVRDFISTEVLPEYEGQGLGGKLVDRALEESWAEGLEVIGTCPFVAACLKREEDGD